MSATMDPLLRRSRAAAAGRSQNRAARRRPIVVNHAEDPDGCADVIAELVAEYEVYIAGEHEHCPNCPVARSGPFIAYSMLGWKAIYADGCLDRWTVPAIHEYMLDHFPRKVSADRHLLGATPACVRDLMYFLADRGSLRGEDPSLLGDAADELFEQFVEANRDRRNWGFAKQTFTGPLGAIAGRMADRAEPEADERAARPVGNVDGSLGNRRRAKVKASPPVVASARRRAPRGTGGTVERWERQDGGPNQRRRGHPRRRRLTRCGSRSGLACWSFCCGRPRAWRPMLSTSPVSCSPTPASRRLPRRWSGDFGHGRPTSFRVAPGAIASYVEPTEAAWETLGEALDPFLKDVERLLRLRMRNAAQDTALGIVAGLYRCRDVEDPELLLSWAPDLPADCADEPLRMLREAGIHVPEGELQELAPEWAG